MREGPPQSSLVTRWYIEYVQELVIAVLLVLILFSYGALGFVLIEGWSLLDSLYMTAITLSTVGFEEVHPLSQEGRVFCMVLIILGVTVFAYCFGTLGRTFLQGELQYFGKVFRMEKRIGQLKDHVIVCGYGRLAQFVVPELIERGENVVVVEEASDRVQQLLASQVLFIEGNAYDDDVLQRAGVTRARTLLALLSDDAHNVFITLSARGLNPDLTILARTERVNVEKKLYQAGANQVLSPYRAGSSRIIQQLLHPGANDFLEIASDQEGNHLMLEQIVVSDGAGVVGKTIQESAIRPQTGILIAALIGRDGILNLNPNAQTVLDAGSTLIALGTEDSIEKLEQIVRPADIG
ncbi:MAG: potassium channel protein [Bdellovibrionales bacterium]|nr:potassium channel protein [Bdellovibrionales bacterium]